MNWTALSKDKTRQEIEVVVMTRLRNMQAEYEYYKNSYIDGVVPYHGLNIHNIKHHNTTVLTSYQSDVAIYDIDSNICYLLPRWDYSVTTLRHLRAFVDDVMGKQQFNLKELRKHNYQCCEDVTYILCQGYYTYYNSNMKRW